MCSLNDYKCYNNGDEIFESVTNSSTDGVVCRKCRSENIDVLLIGRNGYCKNCFLIVTNHKFRATLGKHKIIRPGDTILIDHSGELNSTVLLHLIKSGMSESAHKKLIFKTAFLHIDDSAITGKTNEDRYKIAEQITNFGFDGYIVSLSQVLDKENALDVKSINCQQVNSENDRQLCGILADLPDDTSRMDFLNRLHRKLLISVARKLNCNKIFIVDSTIDIATKVLADVCLGRGTQLSTLASFCDTQCDIKILKPMRDFTQQELVYYSKCYQLDPIRPQVVDVTVHPVTSIQALAHNFAAGLESQFCGTISTIFRTAEKLSARDNEHQDLEDDCILCDARLNFVSLNNEVSAMRAIEISKLISSKYVDKRIFLNKGEENESDCMNSQLNDQESCKDNGDTCSCKGNKKEQINPEDIWSCLCYSCKLIFRNSDILHTLPAPLMFAAQQRSSLKNMREEIKDFFL